MQTEKQLKVITNLLQISSLALFIAFVFDALFNHYPFITNIVAIVISPVLVLFLYLRVKE